MFVFVSFIISFCCCIVEKEPASKDFLDVVYHVSPVHSTNTTWNFIWRETAAQSAQHQPIIFWNGKCGQLPQPHWYRGCQHSHCGIDQYVHLSFAAERLPGYPNSLLRPNSTPRPPTLVSTPQWFWIWESPQRFLECKHILTILIGPRNQLVWPEPEHT